MDRINIEPGETILLKIRKHWIMLLQDTAGTILLALLPFAIVALLFSFGLMPEMEGRGAMLTFLSAFWLLIIWIALAIVWTDYYADIWIVTNRRIFNIEQIGLFERRVATWALDRVQEIAVKHAHFIETLLGYGEIEVETAGPADTHAIARGIPKPEMVRTLILEQIGRIDKLEETTKQQENLLHTIGHEVKGYLAKNSATLASIAEGDYGTVPPELKSMADSTLKETRKGISAIMNILDSSNMREGTLTLRKTRFEIKSSINQVLESLRSDAEKKGLTIELLASEGRFEIEGDETKLRELVLRSLVDNAIRYTPSGGVRVILTRSDRFVVVSVKDTGIGLAHETFARLFTADGNDAASKSLNPESTGYGLAIAKSIVDAHGGRIWAESEGAGKGAQFIVELPAAA